MSISKVGISSSLTWYYANRKKAQARNAAWKASNRERVRKQDCLWRKNNEKQRAKKRAYDMKRRENIRGGPPIPRMKRSKEELRAAGRAYYRANKASILAKAALRSCANSQKAVARVAAWRKSHPEAMKISRARDCAKRRAREKTAIPILSAQERAAITEIYRRRDLLTKLTGVQYHVDHVISLKKHGKHHPDNLQVLTATENMRKGAR